MEKQIDRRLIDRLVKVSEDINAAEEKFEKKEQALKDKGMLTDASIDKEKKAIDAGKKRSHNLWLEIHKNGQGLGLSREDVTAQAESRAEKILDNKEEKQKPVSKVRKGKSFDWSTNNPNAILLGSLIAGLLLSVPIYIGFKHITAPKKSIGLSMEEGNKERMRDYRFKEIRLENRRKNFYDIAGKAIEVSKEKSVADYNSLVPKHVSKKDLLAFEIYSGQDNSWDEFRASDLWSDMEVIIDSDVYKDKLVSGNGRLFDTKLLKILSKGMLDFMNESRGLSGSDSIRFDFDSDGFSIVDDENKGRSFVVGVSSIFDVAQENQQDIVLDIAYWDRALKSVHGFYKEELRENSDKYLKEQLDNERSGVRVKGAGASASLDKASL